MGQGAAACTLFVMELGGGGESMEERAGERRELGGNGGWEVVAEGTGWEMSTSLIYLGEMWAVLWSAHQVGVRARMSLERLECRRHAVGLEMLHYLHY